MQEKINESDFVERLGKLETSDEAFRQFFKIYSKRLYVNIRRLVANQEDANDIMQDTFMKAYQNISAFRCDSSLFTWLFRIAVNETLTFLNKQNHESSILIAANDENVVDNVTADEYFDGDELRQKLEQAITSLPAKQRIVFNMKYFDNMKYEEMSELLDTSVGALKASYHHAVLKLKQMLDVE